MKNEALVYQLAQSANQKLANTVHFILQAKGGIGKSYVASMLTQYFMKIGIDVKGFDLDQENATFADFEALGVTHINVYDSNRDIDPRRFDELMEVLLNQDGTFVIDTGANTFSSLLCYLVENDVFELLERNNKKIYVHTIVGGGAELAHTANGFNSIAQSTSAPIILWLNEHFGALEVETGNFDEDGKKITKSFTDMKVFKSHEDRLAGVVMLHFRNTKTFGVDIRKMNTLKLTVDEVMANQEFNSMAKDRIGNVAKDIFGQLSNINFD